MTLVMIISIIMSFILGCALPWIIMVKESSGTIYLSDDGVYLAMSSKEAKKIEKSAYCIVQIKRKNFSGFNEVE